MTDNIVTVEQRLATLIGQVLVENAKLGVERDTLFCQLVKEREKISIIEKQLQDLSPSRG